MVTYNDDNKNDNEENDKKEKDNKEQDNNNSDLGDPFWEYQGDDPNAYQQTAKGKGTLTLGTINVGQMTMKSKIALI